MTAYKTQGALRKALEERLKQKSKLENVDINRLRRQLAFDRLLALVAWRHRIREHLPNRLS